MDMVRQIKGVKSVKIKEDKNQSYSAKLTNAQKQQNVNIIKKEQFSNTTEGHGFSKTDNELNEKVVTVDKTIAKEVFNNDAIGVPSGKCGFTTLSLFSRRLPQF